MARIFGRNQSTVMLSMHILITFILCRFSGSSMVQFMNQPKEAYKQLIGELQRIVKGETSSNIKTKPDFRIKLVWSI